MEKFIDKFFSKDGHKDTSIMYHNLVNRIRSMKGLDFDSAFKLNKDIFYYLVDFRGTTNQKYILIDARTTLNNRYNYFKNKF